METMNLVIEGTHCPSCKMLVEDILEEMNIKIVSFEMNETKKESYLLVQTDREVEEIKKSIEEESDFQVQEK